jgi:DNA-binding IclR family transcriptional regulator
MNDNSVQTLSRALDILETLALSPNSMGVTEIGQRLNLHKSTAHRLLNALAARGYVEKTEGRGSYRLGLKVVEIGSLRLNHIELKTEAAPFLRELTSTMEQSVHLGILSGTDVVYIDKVEPLSSIRMYSQIGKRVPIYCTALGKALFFDRTREEIIAFASGLRFEAFTPSTIRDAQGFAQDVAASAKRGWSLDDEEHEEGIRCMGAPIRDYRSTIIAAVSVTGSKASSGRERDRVLSQALMATAREISIRMGYSEANR